MVQVRAGAKWSTGGGEWRPRGAPTSRRGRAAPPFLGRDRAVAHPATDAVSRIDVRDVQEAAANAEIHESSLNAGFMLTMRPCRCADVAFRLLRST